MNLAEETKKQNEENSSQKKSLTNELIKQTPVKESYMTYHPESSQKQKEKLKQSNQHLKTLTKNQIPIQTKENTHSDMSTSSTRSIRNQNRLESETESITERFKQLKPGQPDIPSPVVCTIIIFTNRNPKF